MKPVSQDPLLRIARLILTALLGLSVLVVVGAAVVILLMIVNYDYLAARVVSNDMDPSAVWWVGCLVALIAATAGLAFLLVRHLRAIVDTVSKGDPFTPLNADRLRRMGWLTLAIQVVAVPMTRLWVWFDAAPEAANVYHNRNGISAGALILALILFILARVFREGTRLRDDVESIV